MANKPSSVCTLKEGKHIASFKGFVGMWNWLASYVWHLKGDGDEDGKGLIKVEQRQTDRPVVTFNADAVKFEWKTVDGGRQLVAKFGSEKSVTLMTVKEVTAVVGVDYSTATHALTKKTRTFFAVDPEDASESIVFTATPHET